MAASKQAAMEQQVVDELGDRRIDLGISAAAIEAIQLAEDARGDREAVDREGGGIGAKDTNGRTPLSLAVENGHEAVVRLLKSKPKATNES
jgi:hypothetical protein